MGAVSCKKEVRINRMCGELMLVLLSFSDDDDEKDDSEHNIVKAFCIF
jgi:hypothetical protein